MKLTPEQESVVAINSGRHLVLAPPGSGKTEMLSQRIIRVIASGVDSAHMLRATFECDTPAIMAHRLAGFRLDSIFSSPTRRHTSLTRILTFRFKHALRISARANLPT